jgi:hypothetical protein
MLAQRAVLERSRLSNHMPMNVVPRNQHNNLLALDIGI